VTTSATTRPAAADLASQLRGFGPLGILAIVIVLTAALGGPLVTMPVILLWAWLSRTPAEALGFARPRSWPLTIGSGVAAGVLLKLVAKSLVMPLLGAPAMNARYHYLAGNTAALPSIIGAVIISAGIGEELFFRSYLFERLGALFGRGRSATIGIIVFTSILFGAVHYPDQRLPGVEQAIFTGLVSATIYARTRRIWMVMIMHAVFDLTAVALIYWNLETSVAHWIF
jgi:membrane protease YdiL (CAAX protease family)